MKTKIVSAIYFDLYGTSLGGRPGRNDHYLYSLNSIMNISNAEFIVYTNDKNKIDTFYQEFYPDKVDRLSTIEYDLYNTEYSSKINKIKDIESTKQSVRCIELQYSKLSWIKLNAHDCDYIYWIDAGLCYSGLIPDKYLNIHTGKYFDSYYGSNIFTNELLNNLNNYTNNQVFVCAKENRDFYWDSSIPCKYFIDDCQSCYHIIGGLFGGYLSSINYICDKFSILTNTLLDNEPVLYSEEQILSCLFFSYPNYFKHKMFHIWWHENNISGAMPKEDGLELLKRIRSFYKIIEEFI